MSGGEFTPHSQVRAVERYSSHLNAQAPGASTSRVLQIIKQFKEFLQVGCIATGLLSIKLIYRSQTLSQ